MQAATTEIRATTVDELRQHAGALLVENWEESGRDEPGVLDVDWDAFCLLEASGALVSVGIWEDSEIVGYALAYVSPNLHRRGLRRAVVDTLFIRADHRGKGGFLMLAVEREARAKGASDMTWTAKPGSEFEASLSHSSYTPIDVSYRKELD